MVLGNYVTEVRILFTSYANACGYAGVGLYQSGGTEADVVLRMTSPTAYPSFGPGTYNDGTGTRISCASQQPVPCNTAESSATNPTNQLVITAIDPDVVGTFYESGLPTASFSGPQCSAPPIGRSGTYCCAP
jgi:hypothetical protein